MRQWSFLVTLLAAIAAAAVVPRSSHAQSDLSLTTGSVFRHSMESMSSSSPTLTLMRLGYSTSIAGVAVEYNRGSWPWPPPPSTGDPGVCPEPLASLILGLEGYPLSMIDPLLTAPDGSTQRPTLRRISRVLRPFVGVGVLHADEWIPGQPHQDTDDAGEVLDMHHQSALIVNYGSSLLIPTMIPNLRVDLQYRRGHRLAGEMGAHLPTGEVASNQPASSWGQWHFGFNLVTSR